MQITLQGCMYDVILDQGCQMKTDDTLGFKSDIISFHMSDRNLTIKKCIKAVGWTSVTNFMLLKRNNPWRLCLWSFDYKNIILSCFSVLTYLRHQILVFKVSFYRQTGRLHIQISI
jgi:hypothetical protein